MRVLVTGGAGYIGSHTCVELLDAGHEVFWADTSKIFKNMNWRAQKNIKDICGDTWRFHKNNPTGYNEDN